MATILPKAEAIVPKQAQFLLSAAPPVAQEFAKIAVNIILKGDVAARGYAKAASALQITVDAVDQGVKMLCDIFIRSAQSNLSAVQMTEFLKDLGFHDETRECLVDYCSQRFREIRGLVAVPRLNMPSYRKLEWRLDVQVGDMVLLWDRKNEKPEKHKKFDSLWLGPCIIRGIARPNSFQLSTLEGKPLHLPANGQLLKLFFKNGI